MTKLCINTDEPLQEGEVTYGEVLDEHYNKILISIRCIRKIELSEYMTFVTKNNLQHMVNRSIHDKHLYEVEILD